MSLSLKAQAVDLYVGLGTSGNTRNFTSETNSYLNTYVGYNASYNSLGVFGAGTLLTNSGDIYNGYDNGVNNSLVASNGGRVYSEAGYIGYGSFASNNFVNVSGRGSRWNNNADLSVGYGGGGTLTVSDGGTVFAANITIASQPNSSGVLNVGSFARGDAAGSIIASTVGFGAGKGTINFNQTDSLTFTSTITGAGTVQQRGSGTTTLTASNSYTGGTRITGGTLAAGNAYAFGNSDVAVSDSGTLSVSNALNVKNFTMDGSKASLTIGVGAESYGNIHASGDVFLAGGLYIMRIGWDSFRYGEKVVIFNAVGSIKGEFSSITIGQYGYRGSLQIIGDPQAIITIAPTSYTLVAQNQNQYNVASALDSFISATSGDELTVKNTLDSLTAEQYPNAFNQISPALYTTLATVAFNSAVAQYNEMVQRLGNIRVAGVGFSSIGMNDSPIMDDSKNPKSTEKDILIPSVDNHWGCFVDGNGIFANVNINNQLPGYSAQGGGVTIGSDYKWNNEFSTGLYVGYEGMQSKQSGGNYVSDNGSRFGAFGTYAHGGFFANGILGGDSHSYQVNRGIQFPGMSRTANSSPTAGELDSMLAGGYDMKRGNFTFGPITSLQYTYFGLQPFTESGAQSLDLSVANANDNSMVYSLGSHCFYSWQFDKNILIVPQINLGWQHEFLQNPYALNSTFANGSSFAYNSTTPLRDSLYTGIGLMVNLNKKYDASFFYNASACNPSIMSQNFFVSLGTRF